MVHPVSTQILLVSQNSHHVFIILCFKLFHLSFLLVLIQSEMRFLVDSSSCSNKKSCKCHSGDCTVEQLWDSSFLLEIVLDPPLFSQNKLLGLLRGFIPGTVLNWINPKLISGSLC